MTERAKSPAAFTRRLWQGLTGGSSRTACLKRFFKPVSKVWNGAEHIVIGTENDAGTGCIRDAVALRRFLLDSLKYSLAVSMGRFTGPPD